VAVTSVGHAPGARLVPAPETAESVARFGRVVEAVPVAVAGFERLPGSAEIPEGPTFSLHVGPGAVTLRAKDLARHERAVERAVRRHGLTVRENGQAAEQARQAVVLLDAGLTPVEPLGDEDRLRARAAGENLPTRGRVMRSWSRRSKGRLVRSVCHLDFRPLFAAGWPVMVTLTYSRSWEVQAPTGKTAKRHLGSLRRSYERRFGFPPPALWKLEFQRRGAPHFHLLIPVPHGVLLGEFRLWLSETWAAIVDADCRARGVRCSADERMSHLMAGTGVDHREGARMRDVKRIAVYFTGHSLKSVDGKGYQHLVPELWQTEDSAPGRFWGSWALPSVRGGCLVGASDYVALRRLLRRWAAANGRSVCTGGRLSGGWVAVNDGPAFAFALSRALALG